MDALLLGRKTYDIFANYWPNASEDIPFTNLLNRVPKYVASRTLAEPLAWNGSSLVTGDLAAGVTALKQRHDEVHVIGSLDLVQSLLRHGLVDRLNLWLYPVLLGSGKRVFADGTVPTALQLTASETYPSGAVHVTYETAGVPTYGTM
jgi:dihydrofolate reductase